MYWISYLLILSSLILFSVCTEENKAQEVDAPPPPSSEEVRAGILKTLHGLEAGLSGYPADCYKFIKNFEEGGELITPSLNGDLRIKGQRRIHSTCEARLMENFEQMESFIYDIMIHNHTASFQRTNVFLTKIRCRFSLRGYGVAHFNEKYEVVKYEDHWDPLELQRKWQDCQFPIMDDVFAEKNNKEKENTDSKEKQEENKNNEKENDNLKNKNINQDEEEDVEHIEL